jgi:hypothetical protein
MVQPVTIDYFTLHLLTMRSQILFCVLLHIGCSKASSQYDYGQTWLCRALVLLYASRRTIWDGQTGAPYVPMAVGRVVPAGSDSHISIEGFGHFVPWEDWL